MSRASRHTPGQFLGRINKPDVDDISGIAPAIAIEQKVNTRNPRSTVGTSTEIYDYLKLLFARVGHTFSPVSGREVRCYGVDDVVEYITSEGDGKRVVITCPITLKPGQGLIEKLLQLLGDGFLRVWVDGQRRHHGGVHAHDRRDDRLVGRAARRGPSARRLRRRHAAAPARLCFARLQLRQRRVQRHNRGQRAAFSARFEADGIAFEQPSEHLFSFNNPIGACPRCEGYGKIIGIDEDLVIPDKSKTIYDGAIACWRGATMKWWKEQLIENADKFGFPIHEPYHNLTAEQKLLLWRGNEYFHGLDEFFEYIEGERRKIQFRVMKARYTGKTTCPDCGGSRLRKEALYVRVGGRNIAELVRMTVDELIAFFDTLQLDATMPIRRGAYWSRYATDWDICRTWD